MRRLPVQGHAPPVPDEEHRLHTPYPSPQVKRVNGVRRPLLHDIPVLHETAAVQPHHIHHRRRLLGAGEHHAREHPAAVRFERRALDFERRLGRDELGDRGQRIVAAAEHARVVLDVVLGDVFEVCGGGVPLDEDEVDEVFEDLALLGRGGGAGRAVGGRAVVCGG